MINDPFFLRKKKKSNKKESEKNEHDLNEIIESDLENEQETIESLSESSDKEIVGEKRIRLAREYLQTLRKKELENMSDEDEEQLHQNISRHLKLEQDNKEKKINRLVAEEYVNNYQEGTFKQLKGYHQLSITCSVISSDERYLYSSSKDSVIVKWDIDSCKKIAQVKGGIKGTPYKGHTEAILCLSISSNGMYLASGGRERKIFIWDALNNLELLHIFKGHRDIITGLAFRTGHNTLYSCSSDSTVKIWNVDAKAYVEQLFGHQDGVSSIHTLSKERAISVGGRDRSLRLWKIIEESQLLFDQKSHTGIVECCTMINENLFVTCDDSGKILLWTSFKKKPIFVQKDAHKLPKDSDLQSTKGSTPNKPHGVISVASLHYTDLIASGSNSGSIKLWKVTEKKTLTCILNIPCSGFINSLVFSSSGKYLIASIGQEHKLGRWTKIPTKNSIKVFQFIK